MKQSRLRAAGPLIALATTLLAFTAWCLLPHDLLLRWMEEGAAVEDFTIVLYLMAAAWLLCMRHAMPTGVTLALALAMAAFAAREAHWHIEFTGTSMLRVSYYLGPSPTIHKAASLTVVALLLSSWAYLLRAMVRASRARLLGSGALGANIAAFLAVLVATKLLDRMLAVAAEDFGLAGGPAARALQLALEEPLEMVLPVIVVAAAWQYRVASRGAPPSTVAAAAVV